MKTIICFIFCLLFTSLAFAQVDDSPIHNEENGSNILSKNHIEQVAVYSCRFDKKGIKDSALDYIHYFDAAGHLTKEEYFKSPWRKNKWTRIYENSYYANGKLMSVTKTSPGEKYVNRYHYEYDALDSLTYEYEFNRDTTSLKIKQRMYNDKHQKAQLFSKGGNDPMRISRKYYYDEKERLSKMEAFGLDGKMIYMYTVVYDMEDRRKSIYFDGKTLVARYTFDDNGLCILSEEFNTYSGLVRYQIPTTHITVQNTETLYNDDHTIKEVIYFVDGKKVAVCRFSYNEKG